MTRVHEDILDTVASGVGPRKGDVPVSLWCVCVCGGSYGTEHSTVEPSIVATLGEQHFGHYNYRGGLY